MMTVVPTSRMAPTDGNMPLRTFHSRVHSSGSAVKRTGPNVCMPAKVASMARTCAASCAPSAARVSTSSAAPCGPTARIESGSPGFPSTERNAARSASSTAATGALFNALTARQAASRSSKRMSALALSAYSGTVRYVISLKNPSVPSEPIMRCARMSIGSVKSTNALRL